MKTLTYIQEKFTAPIIVKGPDYITGYDSDYTKLFSFEGVLNFNSFYLDQGQDWDLPKTSNEPLVIKFDTTIVNVPYKHYKPSINLEDGDYVQVVYNGLNLEEDVDWEPEIMFQGESAVIKLLIEESDNDNYNKVNGTIFRGIKKK